MEYENELDLGLGLSCGDSSSKTVKNDAATVVIPTDGGDKEIEGEGLNNFLHSGNVKEDADGDKHQSDRGNFHGSFFEKLSMGVNEISAKKNEDSETSCTTNKRKLLLDEINDKKRHESDVHRAGTQDIENTPHVSINTDDGSAAENEDVAESEVECSIPVSNKVTTIKNSIETEGTKNFNPSSDNEAIHKNMNGSAPYLVRPSGDMKIPAYPLYNNLVQLLPPANIERPPTPPNSQMAFGYLPSQLPVLTRDHAWGTATRPQQPNNSNFCRVPDHIGIASSRQLNDATNENVSKLGINASRNVAEADASKITSKKKASNVQPSAGNTAVIKQGIAADIKFGGSGTCPNLPWVSTTGTNGRIISGVTYRFSPNQIKIVCACHGSHLTPEEFVRHASDGQ